MYFLLYIIITASIYIYSFNKDFKAEDLSKVVPFMVIVGLAALVLTVLGSLGG